MYGIFGDLWSCLKDTTNKSHTKAKTGNDQDNGNNKNIFKKKERNTGILAILEKPIGLVNEKWNYKAMSYETVGLIKGQTIKYARSQNKKIDIIHIDKI